MLSYQHIFHAGNHADILKHTVLSLVLEHLNSKEKPYTVIDTHAGSARYYLNDERAQKTNDADTGINKLFATEHAEALATLVAPNEHMTAHNAISNTKSAMEHTAFLRYCNFVRACLSHGFYPGSPEIARHFMRKNDCLILCELHKAELAALKAHMKLPPVAVFSCHEKAQPTVSPAELAQSSVRAHIHFRDGFDALSALTPPAIARGLAFVDPSYEDADEYEKVASAFEAVWSRWRAAIFAVWYPLVAHRKIACATMKQKIIARAKSSMSTCNIVDVQLLVNTAHAHKEQPLSKYAKEPHTEKMRAPQNKVALRETAHIKRRTHDLKNEHAHKPILQNPTLQTLPISQNPPRLYGSGVLLVNAPWKFAETTKPLLEKFAHILGVEGCGSWSVECY